MQMRDTAASKPYPAEAQSPQCEGPKEAVPCSCNIVATVAQANIVCGRVHLSVLSGRRAAFIGWHRQTEASFETLDVAKVRRQEQH